MCGVLDSQEYVGVSKAPMDILFPAFSFKAFWLAFWLLLLQELTSASGSCEVTNLIVIVFNKCPMKEDTLYKVSPDSGHVQTNL